MACYNDMIASVKSQECQTSVPIEQRPMMSRLEDRQTVMPMGCLNLGGDGEEY